MNEIHIKMLLGREAASLRSVMVGFVFVTSLLTPETSAETTAYTTYIKGSYTPTSYVSDSSDSSGSIDYVTSLTTEPYYTKSDPTSDQTSFFDSSLPFTSDWMMETSDFTSTTSSETWLTSDASDSPSSTTSAARPSPSLVPNTSPVTPQTQGTGDMSTNDPQSQSAENSQSDTKDVQLQPWVIANSILILVLIIVIVCGAIYFRRRLSRGATHRTKTIEEVPTTAHRTEGREGAGLGAESSCATDVAPEFIELESVYSSAAGNRGSEHLYGSLGTQGIYSTTTTTSSKAPLVSGAPSEPNSPPPRSPKKGRQKGHRKDKRLERAQTGSCESGDGSVKDKLYENVAFN